jgi:hypothetical protein
MGTDPAFVSTAEYKSWERILVKYGETVRLADWAVIAQAGVAKTPDKTVYRVFVPSSRVRFSRLVWLAHEN